MIFDFWKQIFCNPIRWALMRICATYFFSFLLFFLNTRRRRMFRFIHTAMVVNIMNVLYSSSYPNFPYISVQSCTYTAKQKKTAEREFDSLQVTIKTNLWAELSWEFENYFPRVRSFCREHSHASLQPKEIINSCHKSTTPSTKTSRYVARSSTNGLREDDKHELIRTNARKTRGPTTRYTTHRTYTVRCTLYA